jgi:chloramphenicol O-acetyltransferase type A
MKVMVDQGNWKRKAHFDFFKKFTEPFFGFTVMVDCTHAYREAKEKGHSFFLHYLHKSLLAVHAIENFRYRIQNDQVWLYDRLIASPTLQREDGTFGYGYFEFDPDFEIFAAKAKIEIEAVQNASGLKTALTENNVIHYSSIPWINFTSLSHARAFDIPDSIPKICFGKMTEEHGKRVMPMSVHVHHGLVDGYHVGMYVDLFQKMI